VDLGDAVSINEMEVEVYNEATYIRGQNYPHEGEKLNKPAIITLYNVRVRPGRKLEKQV
jgi:hypothetical protein